MRNEEDSRWQARWAPLDIQPGTESEIIHADPVKLLRVMNAMNLLHMNDSTRAMLRDRYPEVYHRLIVAQYADAEQRLLALLKQQ